MTRALVISLPGNEDLAGKIAHRLDAELGKLATRNFPDGETYLRLESDTKGRDVVLVCTLDRPDPKSCRLCSRRPRHGSSEQPASGSSPHISPT